MPAADPRSSGTSLTRACLRACAGVARALRGTALTEAENILLVGMFCESEHGNDRILTGAPTRRAQIQADLGEGHVNVIKAKEAILTDQVLCKALARCSRLPACRPASAPLSASRRAEAVCPAWNSTWRW